MELQHTTTVNVSYDIVLLEDVDITANVEGVQLTRTKDDGPVFTTLYLKDGTQLKFKDCLLGHDGEEKVVLFRNRLKIVDNPSLVSGNGRPKRKNELGGVIIPDLLARKLQYLMRVQQDLKNNPATITQQRLYLGRNRHYLQLLATFMYVEIASFWDEAHDDPRRFKKDYDLAAITI